MQWWPFGRKKEREGVKPRSKSFGGTTRRPTDKRSAAPTPRAVSSAGQRPGPSSHHPELPTARTSIDKLPVEEPEEPHPAQRSSREDITALPQSPPDREFETGPHLRSFDEQRRPVSSRQAPVPSSVRRQPSTKTPREKKQRDREREDAIRELSSPIPIPGRSSANAAVSRKLSHRRLSLQPAGIDRSSSQVSLGSPGSIRSGIGEKVSNSVHHWELGALDMFSPRPKVRYSMTEYNKAHTLEALESARSSSDARKEWNSSNRIDEIAEDLDVTTIRELMERDARRLEKKKEAQEERARKRLERHAAKKRGEKSEEKPSEGAADSGEESSRAFAGLGLQGEYAGPSSPVDVRPPKNKRDSAQSPRQENSTGPEMRAEQKAISEATAALVGAEKSGPALATRPTDPTSPSGTDPPKAKAGDLAKDSPTLPPLGELSSSPPALHSRRASAVPQPAEPRHRSAQDLAGTQSGEYFERRASDISSRRTGALASLFRRSKRIVTDEPESSVQAKDEPLAEKSFSNTSRESMGRQALPAHLVASPTPPKRRSLVPQRTMSKFREDLPESPASPVAPNTLEEELDPLTGAVEGPNQGTQPLPIRGTSGGSTTADPYAAAGLSQSLASVDSEASWLTGSNAPRKRASRPNSPNSGTLAERPAAMLGSFEDLGKSDEAFFKQQVVPRERLASRLNVDAVRESGVSDQDEDNLDAPSASDEQLLYQSAAKQAVLVERRGSARSREGILQQVAGDAKSEAEEGKSGISSEDSDGVAGIHPNEPSPAIEEATAVQHAHHVRTVSSGSARLLDITRKDSKRLSAGSDAASKPVPVAESASTRTPKATDA